jgi:hypothetical protein
MVDVLREAAVVHRDDENPVVDVASSKRTGFDPASVTRRTHDWPAKWNRFPA